MKTGWPLNLLAHVHFIELKLVLRFCVGPEMAFPLNLLQLHRPNGSYSPVCDGHRRFTQVSRRRWLVIVARSVRRYLYGVQFVRMRVSPQVQQRIGFGAHELSYACFASHDQGDSPNSLLYLNTFQLGDAQMCLFAF